MVVAMNKKRNSVVFSVALPTHHDDLHRIIEGYDIKEKAKMFSATAKNKSSNFILSVK